MAALIWSIWACASARMATPFFIPRTPGPAGTGPRSRDDGGALVDAALPLQEFGAVGRRSWLAPGRRARWAGRVAGCLRRLTCALASSTLRRNERRGSVSGWNASQITEDLGSTVVGKAAENPLAGRPVDPDHADAGRSDERDLRHVLEGDLGELLEDRRRDAAALGAMAHRPRLVIADIDARRRLSGVPPMNQTLVGPDVVPVLPNIGRSRSRSTVAVPRSITPSMMWTI